MTKFQIFVYPAIAALSLAAAFSAHAQSYEGADYDAISSRAAANVTTNAVSRAQVTGALAQARTERAVDVYSYNYNPATQARSVKSRAEVQAEVRALRGSNFAQAWYGEDSGSFAMSQYGLTAPGVPMLAARPVKSSVGQ